MTARCLSVKQPWAWMLLYGGKCVENRKWGTSYRGPVLIQCGKQEDKQPAESYEEYCWELAAAHLNMQQDEAWWHYNHDREYGRGSLGTAIGWVYLWDCIKPGIAPKAGRVWRDAAQYGWQVRDPRPLSYPFDLKGQLGLFSVELPEGIVSPYSNADDRTAGANTPLTRC